MGPWVYAKGTIFLWGNTKAVPCEVSLDSGRPAQGQRSPTVHFPNQRFQSPSHQCCSTLINLQAHRQRQARLLATAHLGRVQNRSPSASLGALKQKPKRHWASAGGLLLPAAPASPRLPSIRLSSPRKSGSKAGLCAGLFSFFCSLEELAWVSLLWTEG